MSKGRNNLLRLISKLVFLSPYLFILVKEFAGVLKHEAKSAGNNFCGIIVYSILFSGMLLTLWISGMVLVVIHFMNQGWSIELSILLVMLINFTLLLIFGYLISRSKRHLLFRETRNRLFKKKIFSL